MVLAAAGGVDHEHLVEMGKKYFGEIEHGSDGVLAYEPGTFKQSYVSGLQGVLIKHSMTVYTLAGHRAWGHVLRLPCG